MSYYKTIKAIQQGLYENDVPDDLYPLFFDYYGKIDESVEGIMFYSPSTVQSFMQNNDASGIAFCIGESTAREAKKHFENVRISKVPTVESVIELVNDNYV